MLSQSEKSIEVCKSRISTLEDLHGSIYNENLINNLVGMWVINDCEEWVCDCFDLPSSALCIDGECELAKISLNTAKSI